MIELIRSAFADRFVWLDIFVLLLLGGVHIMATREALATPEKRAEYPSEGSAVELASAAVRSASIGGVTAVGILLPLTLLAIDVRSTSAGPSRNAAVLTDFFIAELWFALSLGLGIWVVWQVALRASTGNVLTQKAIVIPFGWQLLMLAAGVLRLFVATALLISRLLPQ